MPAAEVAPPASTPLADLFECKQQQRGYDSALNAASLARELIKKWLGPDWLQRYLPEAVAAELDRPIVATVRRQGPRRDKNDLFGLNLPPAYVAMCLRDAEQSASGWTVLQAVMLAGILVRHRDGRLPGKVHTDAIAHFLTVTDSATVSSDTTAKEGRLNYIDSLKPDAPLATVLAPAEEYLLHLPPGFVESLQQVGKCLKDSRRALGPRPPAKVVDLGKKRPPTAIKDPVRVPVLSDDESGVQVDIGPSIPISPEQIEKAIETAETPSEQVPSTLSSTSESVPETGTHQREAYSRRLFLEIRQALWARNQWDALTSAEMHAVVRKWSAIVESALASGNVLESEAGILTLLGGCTGWKDNQLWTTPLIKDLSQLPDGHQRAILLDRGVITFRVPQIGARYDPDKRGHRHLLVPVSNRVELYLPTMMVEILRRYADTQSGQSIIWITNELEKIQGHVRERQRENRLEEPRETTARLRNAHLLELLNVSQDLPLTQLASGELMGVDDVGLGYFSVPMARVQAQCNQVWERHGYGSTVSSSNEELVGGSQLQLSDETTKHISSHNRKGLSQPNGHVDASRAEKFSIHENLVPAVAWQLCAATALRPSEQLGVISIRNFSLRGRCAVFAEKILDAGHLGRPVPLCQTLIGTLTAYGHHLVALETDKGLPQYFRDAAKKALEGTGPLFFIAGGGKVRPLSLKDMRRRLPRGWLLPLNAFRHRLASKLRVATCPGVYIEALLGHVAMGIQPFGSESFMQPPEFLEVTGNCIQQLIAEDGWQVLYGLPAGDQPPWDATPLGPWVMDVVPAHLKIIDELRAASFAQLENYRTTQWQQLQSKVDRVLDELAPQLLTSRDGQLDDVVVRSLRSKVTEQCESQAECQVLVEALRQRLVEARDKRNWKVGRLPYFHKGPVEPSPFSPQYPAVLESFLQLREHFQDVLNGVRKAPRSLTRRTRLVLALILWHGVCDWPRLEAILRNLHRGHHIEGLDDAIAVPIGLAFENDGKTSESKEMAAIAEAELEWAEVLRGPVAWAAADYVSAGHPVAATMTELGTELEACVPIGICRAKAKEFVAVLLEAARITHCFEHAPPLRDVWTGKISSVGAPASRLERYFSLAPISSRSPSESVGRDQVDIPPPRAMIGSPAANEQKWYAKLRDVLRVPRGKPKYLPYKDLDVPLGTDDAKLREEIVSELETYLATIGRGEGTCRLLAQYAQRLLTRKSPFGVLLEPQTVYGYVVHAGGCLVRTHPGIRLLGLESEALFAAYKESVDLMLARYRPWVARYLSYFHSYLVSEHEAMPIDLRGMGGSLAGRPDVGIIPPREYQAAQRRLSVVSNSDTVASTLAVRQARQVLKLGYATGARSAEVALRERRDLVTEEGRAALLVRANRLTGVKTFWSSRVLSLDGYVSPSELAEIGNQGDFSTRELRANAPLFPDADRAELPINPDLLSGLIGTALRAVTGESAARQYWLRHNAASLELLQLFADDELSESFSCDADIPVPFPLSESPAESAARLGGSSHLSQIHAAAFRSRRGHATLRTSLTTYVHTIALIEPIASRRAVAGLTTKGIASLVGRTEEWVRQTASRADVSLRDLRAVRKLLVRKLVDSPVDSAAIQNEGQSSKEKNRPITVGAVRRCVECYFRSGSMDEALRRLGATATADAVARQALESVSIKPIVNNGAVQEARRSLLTINAERIVQRIDLGERGLDSEELDKLLERMRQEAKKSTSKDDVIWNMILLGADTRDQVVRLGSVKDIIQLVEGLPDLIKKAMPTRSVVLVVPEGTDEQSIQHDLRAVDELKDLTVLARPMRRLAGTVLPVAIGVRSAGGQLRLSTLVVAATIWRVWTNIRVGH